MGVERGLRQECHVCVGNGRGSLESPCWDWALKEEGELGRWKGGLGENIAQCGSLQGKAGRVTTARSLRPVVLRAGAGWAERIPTAMVANAS